MDKSERKEMLAVCVCTKGRPNMLRKCLESLLFQEKVSDIDVSIVVVDNEAVPTHHNVAAGVFTGSGVPCYYYHEATPGISQARNKCLDAAMEVGADWIAFIDDDEVADRDWVKNIMAKEFRHVPIVTGRHVFIKPYPVPFWYIHRDDDTAHRHWRVLKTASTNCVRFSIDVVKSGLRFDETIGFMGGEDVDFFSRARAMGFEIRYAHSPVVREWVHPERVTFWGQFYRNMWCSASDVVLYNTKYGFWGALSRKIMTIPVHIVFGICIMVVSPLYIIGGVDAFKLKVLKSAKHVAKACGRAIALAGMFPKPYKTISGS